MIENYDDWPIALEPKDTLDHQYDNYIAFLLDTARACTTVFEDIVEDSLYMVKDGDGNFYIPEWDYDGIVDMEVGQGYHVMMYGLDTLVYTASKFNAMIASFNTTNFSFVSPTCYNQSIIVESIDLGEIEIEAGDELAAFTPGGICCGGVVCHGFFPLIFAAWEDDETTYEIDGFQPDQEIRFRFWDRSEDLVIIISNTDSQEGRVPLFNDYPYSVVNIGSAIDISQPLFPQEFKLYPNFPNPFNSTTRISFCIVDAGKVEVKVYDQLGRHIGALCNQNLTTGFHNLSWDGTDLNGRPVNSGVYFCRIQLDDKSETIRMVLTK